MPDEFENRIDWVTPALALSVWAAHFAIAWGASSALPATAAARLIAGAATLVGYGALFVLWRRARRLAPASPAGLGLALSGLAIAYTAASAIVG